MIKYFDAHAHIASENEVYKDIDKLLQRAFRNGVVGVVDSGYDLKSSKQALALSEKYDRVLPTCGLQPELLIPGSDVYVSGLDINVEFNNLQNLYLANSDKYKAIGECGLDYYWLDKNEVLKKSEISELREKQVKLFKLQIELAVQNSVPLIIHSRGAEEECLEILKRYDLRSTRVLFHSFTGELSTAKNILEKGYYISFNGILTYSKADDIRKLFKFAWKAHPDLVLSETDSPFLAPSQSGSKVCEPAFIRYTVEKMVDIASENIETLSSKLVTNAQKFYNL